MSTDDFNPAVVKVFVTQFFADIYAGKARKAGYLADVKMLGAGSLIECGGNWSVTLAMPDGKDGEK